MSAETTTEEVLAALDETIALAQKQRAETGDAPIVEVRFLTFEDVIKESKRRARCQTGWIIAAGLFAGFLTQIAARIWR